MRSTNIPKCQCPSDYSCVCVCVRDRMACVYDICVCAHGHVDVHVCMTYAYGHVCIHVCMMYVCAHEHVGMYCV